MQYIICSITDNGTCLSTRLFALKISAVEIDPDLTIDGLVVSTEKETFCADPRGWRRTGGVRQRLERLQQARTPNTTPVTLLNADRTPQAIKTNCTHQGGQIGCDSLMLCLIHSVNTNTTFTLDRASSLCSAISHSARHCSPSSSPFCSGNKE